MRWLWGALTCSAIALSGCGSSGGSNEFPGGGNEGGVGPGGGQDASMPPGLLNDSGDMDVTPPSNCTPRTCSQAGANCGPVADGCGNIIQCGTCASGQSCGGGGTPSVCGGGPVCVPKTCSDPSVSSLCGQQPDGCGGLIAAPCVTCTGQETCGGGGTANKCGGAAACIPTTAAKACLTANGIPMNCGSMPDGCGNLIPCGPNDGGATCPPGETCGGAGDPNVCGSKSVIPLPDGGTITIDAGPPVCTPIPQATACTGAGGVALCGSASNGCGGTYTCATCTSPQTCGGGGTPSVCGSPVCTKKTQQQACANPAGGTFCGPVSDGCGGTLTCPTCTVAGDTCGGGGTASVCGQPKCTPATSCPSNVNCGPWPNGCGGTIASCGTCSGNQSCGAGGTPSVCGTPKCTPLTACPAGKDCGTWPDGCGGTLTCGTNGGGCTPPQICGGGGVPSQCGDGVGDGGACTGVACNVQACNGTGQVATSISGHIYDPAGNDPLYNVVVFVPQVTPSVFTHGPSCDSCGSLYTGQPLVAAVTDAKGFFKLSGVPVMTRVPLVIQIGKWRRQLSIANVKACQDNPQPDGTLKLPSAQNNTGANAGNAPPYEGTGTVDDLPQIAISTGGADTLECLLQRVGVSTNEYTSGATGTTTTNPNGHIHIFTGSGGAPTRPGSPTSLSKLWDTASDLDAYDIVILSCEGAETTGNAADGSLSTSDLANLYNYAGNGGRVFASHFHYSWFNKGTFGTQNLATWTTGSNGILDSNNNDYANLTINTGFTRGQALHDFLKNVNALGPANAVANPADGTGADELNIQSPRHNADVSAANTPSQVWMSADTNNSAPNATEYFSFDTPVGGTGDAGAPYCGRVVFSDLHVGGASGDYGGNISGGNKTPAGCTVAKLSPQERALEFMLFDLSSCPSTGSNLPPPTCTPLTTCPANVTCGPYPNGCGTGNLNCGSCPTGESCVNGACVGCTPLTTCPAGQTCGTYPNGCGTGTISCGTCPSNASCVNGTCEACVPLKACPANQTCGQWPDGCGGSITCGTCPSGQVCNNGACVGGCTPTGCPANANCGQVANGCGGLTNSCGTCAPGTSCGGGGTPNQCGAGDANACVPLTCPTGAGVCGLMGDGCGGVLNCGTCTPPQTCGGGGTPGICGAPNCTPKTCAQQNANCGQVSDGCGGLTPNCGTCTGNDTCGGGGVANVCGTPPCTPRTCQQAGANCGPIGDGCGNVLQCGTCTPPDTCGGGGVASQCGSGGPR